MVYWGYIGIMEKRMETTTVYWGYILAGCLFLGKNGWNAGWRAGLFKCFVSREGFRV